MNLFEIGCHFALTPSVVFPSTASLSAAEELLQCCWIVPVAK